MEVECIATPFGRRAMTLGMLANQQRAESIVSGTTRNKWKLFRAICEARRTLGVTDRALTVLDALLTFYPGDELSTERSLIVFPSNAQLSLRARGMTPATLRRHLAVLVETGLIARKDSANGKRFARRDRAGDVGEAFGFNLTPLLARAGEFETVAAHVIAEREMLRATKEQMTICRRDIAKLLDTAIKACIPGEWHDAYEIFRDLVDRVPRLASVSTISPILLCMQQLREEIVNQLKTNVKTQNIDAKESQNERHIQDSDSNIFYEFEAIKHIDQSTTAAETTSSHINIDDQVQQLDPNRHGNAQGRQHNANGLMTPVKQQAFPLALILKACPQITDYGPGGSIASWRDLISATIVVRSMLNISTSAYQDACASMGLENTATIVACILEKGESVTSAGGYLRNLTQRAQKGEFGVGPMLMALARAREARTGR